MVALANQDPHEPAPGEDVSQAQLGDTQAIGVTEDLREGGNQNPPADCALQTGVSPRRLECAPDEHGENQREKREDPEHRIRSGGRHEMVEWLAAPPSLAPRWSSDDHVFERRRGHGAANANSGRFHRSIGFTIPVGRNGSSILRPSPAEAYAA